MHVRSQQLLDRHSTGTHGMDFACKCDRTAIAIITTSTSPRLKHPA